MALERRFHAPAKRRTNNHIYRCGTKSGTKLDENCTALWKKTETFVASPRISVDFVSTSRETVGGPTGLRGFTGRSLESQTEEQ